MINLALQTAIACLLALLFANAGLHKLRERQRFQAQLAEYRLLPAVAVAAVALLLAVIELIVAATLIIPATRATAGLVAAGLLIGYAVAIAINLIRGRSYIDCGCGDRPQMLSGWLLLRNSLLAAGALSATLPTPSGGFLWSDLFIAVPAFIVICMVYLIVEQLLENASALREWSELRD